MVSVLVIVPYEDIIPAYEEAVAAANASDIRFSMECFYGSDPSILSHLRQYDIVVVRGMTYHALRTMFPELHLIEINMSGADVMNAFAEVTRTYGRDTSVGLIVTDSTICFPETVHELTGLTVKLRVAYNDEELRAAADDLLAQGCRVLVGGNTLRAYCRRKDIPFCHVGTGEAAIKESIGDALAAARIIEAERSRAEMLRIAIDALPYSLLAIGRGDRITLANSVAEGFFDSGSLVGRPAAELLPRRLAAVHLEKGTSSEVVEDVLGQKMLISLTLAESGEIIVSMHDVGRIYEAGKNAAPIPRERGMRARYSFSDIIAEHVSMRQLIAKAIRYAQADGSVLVVGETGTGKELFVQSMHNASSRASGPFVAVNCAAISSELLESELFGYSEGAFTGARKGGRTGLFELADKGTIFLDEIGEMPIQLQAKLLRVLQEKEIRRVGGDDEIPVDVRVMCATNQDIPALVEKGLFRRDLYYRINLLTIRIPPLRDRGDDLGLLFRHFVRLYAERLDIAMPPIDDSAISELRKYRWLGNIRELRNVAERIVVLNGSQRITPLSVRSIDIPESELEPTDAAAGAVNPRNIDPAELYRRYQASGLSLAEFAGSIGVSRTTLWRRFKDVTWN